MTTTLTLVLLAIGMVVGVEWVRRRRVARRQELMAQLTSLATSLGHVLGGQGETNSSLEGFDAGAVVIKVGDKTLRIDVIEALDIQREPEPSRRNQRLRHLVDRERIRQGV